MTTPLQFEQQYENEWAELESALERIRRGGYALALVDVRLPDVDGLDLVGSIREERDDLEIVVITGYSSVASAVTMQFRSARSTVRARNSIGTCSGTAARRCTTSSVV